MNDTAVTLRGQQASWTRARRTHGYPDRREDRQIAHDGPPRAERDSNVYWRFSDWAGASQHRLLAARRQSDDRGEATRTVVRDHVVSGWREDAAVSLVPLLAAAARARLRVRAFGTFPTAEGQPVVDVPGTDRVVPLYLLVPDSRRGVNGRVRELRWALASASSLTLWIALYAFDWLQGWRLPTAAVTILLLIATAFAFVIASSHTPSTRPFSDDVSRW